MLKTSVQSLKAQHAASGSVDDTDASLSWLSAVRLDSDPAKITRRFCNPPAGYYRYISDRKLAAAAATACLHIEAGRTAFPGGRSTACPPHAGTKPAPGVPATPRPGHRAPGRATHRRPNTQATLCTGKNLSRTSPLLGLRHVILRSDIVSQHCDNIRGAHAITQRS